MSGCGNGAVSDDPLTGDWKNTECYGSSGTPPNVASCSTELNFTADLNLALTATENNDPASATKPRCTTTRSVTGQSWSTATKADLTTFTVTGTGAATIQVSGCVHSTDDTDSTTTTDISIPEGDTVYQLSGDSLVLPSGPLAGTYTR